MNNQTTNKKEKVKETVVIVCVKYCEEWNKDGEE